MEEYHIQSQTLIEGNIKYLIEYDRKKLEARKNLCFYRIKMRIYTFKDGEMLFSKNFFYPYKKNEKTSEKDGTKFGFLPSELTIEKIYSIFEYYLYTDFQRAKRKNPNIKNSYNVGYSNDKSIKWMKFLIRRKKLSKILN
jgi:hypothetical protein